MNLQEVHTKITDMQKELERWSERDFGSVLKKTAEIRKRLSEIWSSPPSLNQQHLADNLSKELDELLLREELMWRQRSRATYLREGDRNTKWFQRKATWRRKKNTISKLKNEMGVWVEDEDGL